MLIIPTQLNRNNSTNKYIMSLPTQMIIINGLDFLHITTINEYT